MKDYKILNHTRWGYKYHVVFIPKYRKKQIFGALRNHLSEIIHDLAKRKECKIEEGHLREDHVHICISIPPKHAVSNVVDYLKGTSAISIARNFMGRKKILQVRVFGHGGHLTFLYCFIVFDCDKFIVI